MAEAKEKTLEGGLPRVREMYTDNTDMGLHPASPMRHVDDGVEGFVSLNNIDTVDKHIWEGTVQHTLLAHDTRPVPEDLAKLFLEQHPLYIRIHQRCSVPRKSGERVSWVANITGSPFVEEKVTPMKVVEGKEITQEAKAHPHRSPKTLEFKLHQDQIYYGPEDDRRVINTAPYYLKIYPFERVDMPSSIADTIINRSMLIADPFDRGKVVECRAPSGFEPNITWPLDDIRIYAHLTDRDYFNEQRLSKVWPPERLIDNTPDLLKIKTDLYRHLFFRLISDRYTLPTKEAFDAHKKAQVAESKKVKGARRTPDDEPAVTA